MFRCAFASDTLKCLRQANITALQAANAEINVAGFHSTNTFVPVVDGTFITDRPTQLLKDKKVNTVCAFLSLMPAIADMSVFFFLRLVGKSLCRDKRK